MIGFLIYFIFVVVIYLKVGKLLNKNGINTFEPTWWDMVMYMSLLVGATIFYWR